MGEGGRWEELVELTNLDSRPSLSSPRFWSPPTTPSPTLFPSRPSLSFSTLSGYPHSLLHMHLARHSVSSVPVPSFNSLIINHDGDHFAVATDQGFEVWKIYPLANVARRGMCQLSYRERYFGRWQEEEKGGREGEANRARSPPRLLPSLRSTCYRSITDSINPSLILSTDSALPGSISHASLLHRTSLVFLLGGGSNPLYPPNKLVVWDDRKGKAVLELEFRYVHRFLIPSLVILFYQKPVRSSRGGGRREDELELERCCFPGTS